MTHTVQQESVLTKRQQLTFGPLSIEGYGDGGTITASVRFDDQCGNGHNTFSVTADIHTTASRQRNDIEAGGCLHDEIAKSFPDLARFIKWHLVRTDAPMGYSGNATYHAGDRDHHGLLAGETRQIHNGKTGLPCWKLTTLNAPTYIDAATCPTDVVEIRYVPLTRTGEGKTRNLHAARSAAVWPNATDEELTAPGLAVRLAERLPALMVEFRAAVESLGFTW